MQALGQLDMTMSKNKNVTCHVELLVLNYELVLNYMMSLGAWCLHFLPVFPGFLP